MIVFFDKEDKRNDILFKMVFDDVYDGEVWKILFGYFRFIYVFIKVVFWIYFKVFFDWVFGQQEVNGNKNVVERLIFWFVNDIVEDGQGIDFKNCMVYVEFKVVKKCVFIKKWFEF